MSVNPRITMRSGMQALRVWGKGSVEGSQREAKRKEQTRAEETKKTRKLIYL